MKLDQSTSPMALGQLFKSAGCHNHTSFCDGKNTPEEMARDALAAGFSHIGFSGHSRTRYPSGKNYGVENEQAYLAALRALQHQYAGTLEISVGMEQDFFAPIGIRPQLDFIIGSVHDIPHKATGLYYPVDGPAQWVRTCADTAFGGDMQALVCEFYALTAENAVTMRPEIIGHFDLICKNNAQDALFEQNSSWYRAAALAALDACMETDAVFELNTGGMFRGYLARPYPEDFLLRRLLEKKARVILSADAHEIAALGYGFVQGVQLLKSIGFREITRIEQGKFVQKPL